METTRSSRGVSPAAARSIAARSAPTASGFVLPQRELGDVVADDVVAVQPEEAQRRLVDVEDHAIGRRQADERPERVEDAPEVGVGGGLDGGLIGQDVHRTSKASRSV